MISRLVPANEAQSAILTALKADATLIALVPRIYPQKTPNPAVRPFITLGVPIVTPRYVDGGDAADIDLAVHCFVTKTDTIPDPHRFSIDAAAHVARVVDGIDGTDLGGGAELRIYLGQVQCLREDEGDAWHSFVTLRAEV